MSPKVKVNGPKTRTGAVKNNKLIILTGMAADRTDGVDHNYTEAADGHIVVITNSKAQLKSVQNWVEKRLGLDPISPGTLGLRSKFEELNDVLALVYPTHVLDKLRHMPHLVMDEYDMNLPGNAELLQKRLHANPDFFFKGK